jgi:hypothetical protein
MTIPRGWALYKADFANVAMGIDDELGEVILVRDAEQAKIWRKLSIEVKSPLDAPPFSVKGKGRTFEEALHEARLMAEGLINLSDAMKQYMELDDDINL